MCLFFELEDCKIYNMFWGPLRDGVGREYDHKGHKGEENREIWKLVLCPYNGVLKDNERTASKG